MNAATLLQQPLLALFPHGGQHRARRNAWQSIGSDAAHAADRYEAQVAIAAHTAHAAPERKAQFGSHG
jgi:hypothetical protein